MRVAKIAGTVTVQVAETIAALLSGAAREAIAAVRGPKAGPVPAAGFRVPARVRDRPADSTVPAADSVVPGARLVPKADLRARPAKAIAAVRAAKTTGAGKAATAGPRANRCRA